MAEVGCSQDGRSRAYGQGPTTHFTLINPKYTIIGSARRGAWQVLMHHKTWCDQPKAFCSPHDRLQSKLSLMRNAMHRIVQNILMPRPLQLMTCEKGTTSMAVQRFLEAWSRLQHIYKRVQHPCGYCTACREEAT